MESSVLIIVFFILVIIVFILLNIFKNKGYTLWQSLIFLYGIVILGFIFAFIIYPPDKDILFDNIIIFVFALLISVFISISFVEKYNLYKMSYLGFIILLSIILITLIIAWIYLKWKTSTLTFLYALIGGAAVFFVLINVKDEEKKDLYISPLIPFITFSIIFGIWVLFDDNMQYPKSIES